MNKKGEIVSEPLKIVIYLIVGIFILIGFIVIGSRLIDSIENSKREAQCINSEQWLKIESVLKNLESGALSESFIFYNGDCKLASFTPSHSFQNYKVKPLHSPGKKPELCLCKIEDETCKAYDCYKLSTFDEITSENNQQFTTVDSQDYNSLTLTAEGKTLKISGTLEKPPEPLAYKYEQKFAVLDKNHLIDQMLIQFKTSNIKSFAPIVKETPNQIQNSLKQFTVELVEIPENTDLEYYKNNPKIINLNSIGTSFTIFTLNKEEFYPILKDSQLNLLYLKDNSWQSEPMLCELINNNYMCGVRLETFSKEFAIVKRILQPSISADASLIEYTEQISRTYNVNPNLVKSIIQIESNWNPEAVSACGTAGIAQFVPKTAKGYKLKVPEYQSEWCPDEATTACKLNGKKTKVSVCNSCTKNMCDFVNDERFNARKSIEASVMHLSDIKNSLVAAKIEPNVAYIAAAYNQGSGEVIKCKCIPQGEATNYVAKVTQVYKKLSEQQIASAQGENPT